MHGQWDWFPTMPATEPAWREKAAWQAERRIIASFQLFAAREDVTACFSSSPDAVWLLLEFSPGLAISSTVTTRQNQVYQYHSEVFY